MDLVELGQHPALHAFFTKHALQAVKLNERAWGSYNVGIQRPDGGYLVGTRAWGYGFSPEQAAVLSLFEWGSAEVPHESVVQFLGEQLICELIKVVESIKQTIEDKSDIVPIQNELSEGQS